MDHGFDSSRPWIAILPEPTAPSPSNRLEHVVRLCLQVRGLSVAQFPNAPLAVRIGAVAATMKTTGRARDVAKAVAVAAGVVWGYDELNRGTNWFRRLIGAAAVAQALTEIASSRAEPAG